MKPEQSEQIFIEELNSRSIERKAIAPQVVNEIDKLTVDAYTSRYYRVFTDEHTYVVCLDNQYETDVESHPFTSIQKFLKEKMISLPKIYDMDLRKGYLRQEDLGD